MTKSAGERVGDASRVRVRRVAVTALAGFACRGGDLDPAGTPGPSAHEGMLAHQRLQAEAQASRAAECEVRLVRRTVIDGETLELGGRLDLLERERRALAEIKSTLVPQERVPPARQALHRAQLMLYGWLYLGVPEAGDAPLWLELLYVNLRDGGEPVTIAWQATPEELGQHATAALATWLAWQRGVERRRRALTTSAAALAFPHPRFRAGQRTMSAAVYRCLRDGGTLICEAPTGTGKTVSSLYPAIKALGNGCRRQLLYLTAKVSGRASAAITLERLAEAGLAVSALTLRSRRVACLCERGDCERNAEGRCPMTLGFFDRLPAARAELVEAGVLTEARLERTARSYRLCPHALALQLLPWMDVVVCDYNHVFDPLARLAGLDQPAPHAALLIDEAHNLLARSRDMYSATLTRTDCARAIRACTVSHPLVAARLERLDAALRAAARTLEDATTGVTESVPASLPSRVGDVLESMVATLGDAPPLPEAGVECLQGLMRFALVAELYGEDHRTLIDAHREGRRREVRVRLLCLDAAAALSRQHRLFGASVLFSATLAPAGFYRDALGLPPSTPALALPSPFDAAQALHCVVPWIDTRLRRRTASLDALVRLIRQVSESRVGNHLVFLPSYAYLDQVHASFSRAHPERETWRQLPGQDADARASVLARLATPGHRVGFAILGGVYGEGIDYAGELLIGVVVVGTGLPGVGVEQGLIAGRYRERGLDGFDFAARYPGFTRVQQTAGRVIRGEEDRGVIVLVDARFGERFYRRLFPEYWKVQRPRDEAGLDALLDEFWNTKTDDRNRAALRSSISM